MDAELEVMERKEVWTVIDAKDMLLGKVIDYMWVFANKFNAKGDIVKRKAWLVAKGYTQIQGEDFDETYASVVCLESMWMTIAMAVMLSMHIWQIDFFFAWFTTP